MKPNLLYRILNPLLNADLIPFANVRIQKSLTSKEGSKFYLFNLAVEPNTNLGPYTLINHHISVYEFIEKDLLTTANIIIPVTLKMN